MSQPVPQASLRVTVCIEIPRGSFLKRAAGQQVDFVSPFPCPFNYGSIDAFIGSEGDLLDAVVLGPRQSLSTPIRAHNLRRMGRCSRRRRPRPAGRG